MRPNLRLDSRSNGTFMPFMSKRIADMLGGLTLDWSILAGDNIVATGTTLASLNCSSRKSTTKLSVHRPTASGHQEGERRGGLQARSSAP